MIRRRAGITLAALTTLTTLAVPAASSALASAQPAGQASHREPAPPPKPAAPEIRLNQVGYQPTAPKTAYVMLPARVASVPFTVTDAKGKVVYRGVSRDDVGAWNAGYQAVYLLSFSGLRRCGTYQVRVGADRVADLQDRQRDRPLRPAGRQRGALLHLGTRRGRRRAQRPQPGARQPHRREGGRLRRPALRRQRQPARHAQEGRRPGQRVRRLVRRRRRLREVRLHRQLHGRADADRGARQPGRSTRR